MIPLSAYLGVGAGLFTIGVIGVLIRRQVVAVLMSIELMLNAVNLNLVAFSRSFPSSGGKVFVLFVMLDAIAQAAVGLTLALVLLRSRATVNVDENRLLKW